MGIDPIGGMDPFEMVEGLRALAPPPPPRPADGIQASSGGGMGFTQNPFGPDPTAWEFAAAHARSTGVGRTVDAFA